MATQPLEAGCFTPTRGASSVLWRIAGLIFILSAELLLISSRTPHLALAGAPGLPGLVFALGTWKVRLLVTLAAFALLFWESRGRRNLQRLSEGEFAGGLSWRALLAHVVCIGTFSALTFVIFEKRPANIAAADVLVVAWLAAGVAALMLAAFAVLPAMFWRSLLRGTGDVWAYTLALAVGACVFAAYATPLWNPLAHWTLKLATVILHPFLPGISADFDTLIFGTHSFSVRIAPACSGYEGIGLILAFTSAWLWFFRRDWRFPRALLVIPAGVAAIWIFNALRIDILVLIGIAGAPDIALQGFHSHAGWIAFNVVALGTCVAARRISWLTEPTGSEAVAVTPSDSNPAAPYLLPFLAILAAAMLAGAASNGFEWLYVLRVIAAAAVLWHYRGAYRQFDWRFAWPAAALGAVVFGIWLAAEPLSGSAHSSIPVPLAESSARLRAGWIAVRVIGGVVTVPIAEELAFRGFLLRRLISPDFENVSTRAMAWVPVLISSLAFGLMHGERWLAGTIAGILYALAMTRRGRISEAIAAHALTNALLAVYVISTGNWQLW